jgi:hypothetical protein
MPQALQRKQRKVGRIRKRKIRLVRGANFYIPYKKKCCEIVCSVQNSIG